MNNTLTPFKNIDSFVAYQQRLVEFFNKKETKYKIFVCMGGGCIASGSTEVKNAIMQELKRQNCETTADVIPTGCLGPCANGPVVTIFPDRVFYQNVSAKDAKEIVFSHIKNGKIVQNLVYKSEKQNEIPIQDDIPFFNKQTKIVLRNCGIIDPLDINQYICRDGYLALAKALSMKQDEIINEITASGLRGRGGAGFPTGMKWKFTKEAKGDIKYVLCNADEGDPGAFMDRSVLEGDPHSVIEGMIIAGIAIGSNKGYVYVRAEYPLAVERLGIAIEQAKKYGFLGNNILGTNFSFELEIRKGSGAFVCGEETALISSIEGNRGEPRIKPPFPAVKGLWGQPSLLNNVETYANVPIIITKGAKWYSSYGTEKSKGTKVFALAGAVKNTGLVEVPIGTTLGELIYEIGGGIRNNKNFKAAQIGGPSGGCIPKEYLNVPLDYENLNKLGAIMGSGGLIVMDENSCMVDIARYFLEFVQEESCGKCVPCRIGTKRMLEILNRICEGKGEEEDINRLIKLGEQIRDTALCGLGQSAPNPVLSTIRYFRHEYEEHIKEKRCSAGVCPKLTKAPCQNACPAGVDVPNFVALVAEKRLTEAIKLHRERNPFASVCARVCFHPCESKCRRSTLDAPVSVRAIKRFMTDAVSDKNIVPECKVNPVNSKKKIAIIGAGPAGLSCAYFLCRMGYKPKIFEAESKPGGMLVQTIPPYRLPRNILEAEIQMILNLGATLISNKKLGKDFTLESLKSEGYDAVFLGVGAKLPVKLNIPNENSQGVTDALTYLKEYNLKDHVYTGKNVIVIGGGNAAIDSARTAIRLGANMVTIVYRRSREEMPAWQEEIEEAEKEGIKILTLIAPKEIITNNNKVYALKCMKMKLGDFDSSGRRKPIPDSNSEFLIETDHIISAIGQKVDLKEIFNGLSLKTTSSNTIQINKLTGQTSIDWLFSGGDVVSGPSSVVEAISAGERAAFGIDLFLTKENHAFWRKEINISTSFDPDADPVPFNREDPELIPVADRKNNFCEIELSYNENTAIMQAKRCLRCDFGKNIEFERR